jgi:hypothetical protein
MLVLWFAIGCSGSPPAGYCYELSVPIVEGRLSFCTPNESSCNESRVDAESTLGATTQPCVSHASLWCFETTSDGSLLALGGPPVQITGGEIFMDRAVSWARKEVRCQPSEYDCLRMRTVGEAIGEAAFKAHGKDLTDLLSTTSRPATVTKCSLTSKPLW